MRRTKIVSTLGPSSSNKEVLVQMFKAGLNVVRLNFSHGSVDEKRQLVTVIRQAAAEVGSVIGILADMQGPKIRVARFKNGKVVLKDGAEFILDAALPNDVGDATVVGIDYKELPHDVKVADILLLDDGRLELVVKNVVGSKIFCIVKVGGELSNNKGINRQGGGLSAGALTEKDREDIKTAVELQADYIAISFPRSAEDVIEAKKLIVAAQGNAGVIAKIERLEAVVPETLDDIIKASDGIMVARGDLAVEIGGAEVPAAQKYMIERARMLNKPVITATQMLESMIHCVVPTRAEVSDVANAVLDGTDAVMLSAETATGEHPIIVVQTMDNVCLAAEKHPVTLSATYRLECQFDRVDEAISMATMYTANHLNIKAIVSLTESGATPLWMSRIHSRIPIYGLSRNLQTLGKMALYSNVYPIFFDVAKYATITALKAAASVEICKRGLVQKGDLIIITCGDHIGISGGTNSLTIIKM
jgi:pyruvate kinase